MTTTRKQAAVNNEKEELEEISIKLSSIIFITENIQQNYLLILMIKSWKDIKKIQKIKVTWKTDWHISILTD